jgi:hypothetical protein
MAELHLGHWARVVDELGPLVDRILGPRAEDPPYFTQNMMGSLAVIEATRRDPRVDVHVGRLEQMTRREEDKLGRGGIRTWLAWANLIRGRSREAGDLLDEVERNPFGGHLPLFRNVQAAYLAESGLWDRVPAFAEDARRYARDSGILALPFHVDRLEGRAALAAGDPGSAVELLERASDGFASLEARWDRARTDVFLASALADAGRVEEARSRLAAGTAVLEGLDAIRDLERARALAERLR